MFHGYSNEFDTRLGDEYMPLEDTLSLDDLQVPLLSLPPLARQFCIPQLTDKPQNPIMWALRRDQDSMSTSLLFKHPQEFGSLVVDPPLNSRPRISAFDFWKDAITRDLGNKVCLHPCCILLYFDDYRTKFSPGTGCVISKQDKHLPPVSCRNKMIS